MMPGNFIKMKLFNLYKISNYHIFFLGIIFFIINVYLKYPHINRDGLLYINDAIVFSGDVFKFFDLYGLPFYSVILYYINNLFNDYTISSYIVNFLSYATLIIYISKISALITRKKDNLLFLSSSLILFSTTRLMSDYLGLTIRDYLGWSFLIVSFYHMLIYFEYGKYKNLLYFIISIFISCLFRIEYIFLLITVFIYIFFLNNKKRINSISYKFFFVILFLLLILLFIYISPRSKELVVHLNKIFEQLSLNSFIFFIDPIILISKNLISLFLPLILLSAINIKGFFHKNFNFNYLIFSCLYCCPLILLNYFYYLNTQITSTRYFIPILLLLMPIFTINIFNAINLSNKFHRFIFYLIIFILIAININKNYQYKNTAILDFKKYIEKNNIQINQIYFEDNRLNYYYGNVDIHHKEFNNTVFCNSRFTFFLIDSDQQSQIKSNKNFTIIYDPLIHKKYSFIKKEYGC